MKTLQEFLAENYNRESLFGKIDLFEHQFYKKIPGTKNSYREDPGNTNTMTLKHSHVYAKFKAKGEELYSVNFSGTGHDGSSGQEIPVAHASYFRSLGYNIPSNNILKHLNSEDLNESLYDLIIIEKETKYEYLSEGDDDGR